MRVAHYRDIEFTSWPSIRGPNARVKTMLQGFNGKPDDFEFQISTFENEGNGSPRHTHVFDQFRFALKGDCEYDPGKAIPEGSLGYFPEGTHYGPFKIDPKSVFAVMQFGGPSGLGHLHKDQLTAAQKRLAGKGTFERGVYTYVDEKGQKHNRDAHRAVWEEAVGRPIQFPKPRYTEAVVVNPDSYHWREVAPSVSERLLGVFNERYTFAKQIKLKPGATYSRNTGNQSELNFIVDGEVEINGEVCEQHDAIHLAAGEDAALKAKAETTILILGLPAF